MRWCGRFRPRRSCAAGARFAADDARPWAKQRPGEAHESGDEEQSDQEIWTETPDGLRLTETETGHSTWREFQGHASMPADRTTVTEEEIEIPAGRFACLRYTRTDEDGVGIFWFAKSAPGMPLKFEQMVDGNTVFSSTTLSDERPA